MGNCIRWIWITCILILFLSAGQLSWTQNTPSTFDGHAVEGATNISGGVCSNSLIGISYHLPEGMKHEGAEAMRQVELAGAKAIRGIGPEARYFIYGYKETTTAMICGAANNKGSVQMIAFPLSLVTSQGPNALDKLATSLGQQLFARGSIPTLKTVNGLDLKCSDVNAKIAGRTETIQATNCAGIVNSFVVMWTLIGRSEPEWKRLVAGLDSIKVSEPQPLNNAATPAPAKISPHPEILEADFQSRLDGFINEWLTNRNSANTMTFFDSAAYSAPPIIGAYCDGWYRKNDPPNQVVRHMSNNLKGVPSGFPSQTKPPTIFAAWNRLPPQWVETSLNDVAKDHYLVSKLDSASLPNIFGKAFASSDYYKFVKKQVQQKGDAYWVVFPELMRDGDLFVIFTLWQKSDSQWKITHMDIICQ